MTLEQILKAKGWTDADLEAQAPMLKDQRFRSALEDTFGSVTQERDQFKTLNDQWQERLDTDYNPRMTAAEREAQQARLEAANLREQLKIAKDYGYMTPEAEAAASAAAAEATRKAADLSNGTGYDPKKHPTFEDVGKFAEAEGEYHAVLNDLMEEYRFLTGKSLIEYEGQGGKRGMSALRAEAKANRKGIDAYVPEKFDFAGKRAEMARKKQEDHDNLIRGEAEAKVRTEMAQQYGNPLLRSALPSRQPFMPAKPGSDKQPWEFTKKERSANRIAHAMDVQSKSGTVQ